MPPLVTAFVLLVGVDSIVKEVYHIIVPSRFNRSSYVVILIICMCFSSAECSIRCYQGTCTSPNQCSCFANWEGVLCDQG